LAKHYDEIGDGIGVHKTQSLWCVFRSIFTYAFTKALNNLENWASKGRSDEKRRIGNKMKRKTFV
jgi:hypothetical protein